MAFISSGISPYILMALSIQNCSCRVRSVIRHLRFMIRCEKFVFCTIFCLSVIAIYFLSGHVSVFSIPESTALRNKLGLWLGREPHQATQIPPFSETSVRIYIGIVRSLLQIVRLEYMSPLSSHLTQMWKNTDNV
jgi:hypothetical protein